MENEILARPAAEKTSVTQTKSHVIQEISSSHEQIDYTNASQESRLTQSMTRIVLLQE